MKNTNSKTMDLLLRTIKSLVIPFGMWIVFAILSRGSTATTRMFITTLRQTVMPSLVCYGLMLNMSVGMMNFSAGGMMLFAGIVGGNIAKASGTGLAGLVIIVVLFCLAEGAVTGALYNVMRVPCIVLSIGMMLVWESFPKLFCPDGLNISSDITILARSPYCFYVLIVFGIIFYVIYNKTAFGHNLRALGNNQAIANSVGLDSDKNKFLSFFIGALFLGIAAVLYISDRGEVRNVTAMSSMSIMIDGFMGMFIAMFLEQFCDMSIAVVLGTFAMKMLSNGFVAIGMSSTVRDIVQGFFLLVLLIISANAGLFERRKSNKKFVELCNEEYKAIKAGR